MNAVLAEKYSRGKARLGEGPCWNQDEQLLYWVDIYNHRVHQFNPATGAHQFLMWVKSWLYCTSRNQSIHHGSTQPTSFLGHQ